MSIIQKADERVLSGFVEPLAWRVEYRYGIDSIELSRGSYACTLMSVPLTGIVCGNIFVVLLGCFMTPFVMLALAPWWSHLKRRSPHTRNPMRDEWQKRFAIVGVVLVLMITSANALIAAAAGPAAGIVGVGVFSAVTAMGFIYFLSCERMPPGYAEEEKGLVPSAT